MGDTVAHAFAFTAAVKKVCLQTYFLDGGERWRRHRNTTPGNFHSLGSCLLPGIKKGKTKQQQHKKQRKFYTRKCDFNLIKKIILIKQSKAKSHPWGGGWGGEGYGYFLGLLNGAHGAPLRPHRPMRVRIIYYN